MRPIRRKLAASAVIALATTVSSFMFALPVRAALPAAALDDGRPLAAVLTGEAEVDVNGVVDQGDLDGEGTAVVTIDRRLNQVCFDLTVSGIDPATAAHIHQAPVGRNGPVVVGLTAPTPTSSSCVGVDAALVTSIVSNPAGFYVNVHNAAFPNGALRGQLSRGERPMGTILNGASEVDAAGAFRKGDPDGSGLAIITVHPEIDTVCAELRVQRIEAAAAAHIHQAAFGVNGAVVMTLPTPGADGRATACTAVTNELADQIAANPSGFYVNVHNVAFPSGALRGQLSRSNLQYRMASATGEVKGFGTTDIFTISAAPAAGGGVGAASIAPTGAVRLTANAVDVEASPTLGGYWIATADGGVVAFGDARLFGNSRTATTSTFVGMAPTPTGRGYWLVTSTGLVFAHGDASATLGSLASVTLNLPIVGMAATVTGNGYWLVASDGGVFSFGDAVFYGSTGAITLNKPIVGMATTPTGNGYWLVASDGGVFSYGDAVFYGSTGAITLNQPVVGMQVSPTGDGYALVASDGGVFAYGDHGFFGALATAPVAAITR